MNIKIIRSTMQKINVLVVFVVVVGQAKQTTSTTAASKQASRGSKSCGKPHKFSAKQQRETPRRLPFKVSRTEKQNFALLLLCTEKEEEALRPNKNLHKFHRFVFYASAFISTSCSRLLESVKSRSEQQNI